MLGLIVRRAVLLLIHRTPTCVFLSLRVGTSKKKTDRVGGDKMTQRDGSTLKTENLELLCIST